MTDLAPLDEMDQEIRTATSVTVAPAPLPAEAPATSLLTVIERASRDPSVDLDKMERLLKMHKEMLDGQKEDEFNAALAAAQAEMTVVSKDASNPQTRSKYASYAALDRGIRPAYTRHGFSVTFDTADVDGKPDYIRVLAFVSRAGHTRRYHLDMPADGKGAKGGDVMTKTHATGSAVKYGRRYLLEMIFNIATGERDDDGNAASGERKFVSEEQLGRLNALADELAIDKIKFCRALGVDSLADIYANKFEDAVAMMERKRRTSKDT